MSYRDPNRERAAGPVITEARAALSAYSAPGLVADLDTADLVKQWNVTIEHEYHRLANRYGSRFFSLDPSSIPDPTTIDVVKWAADPAEPNFCYDAAIAQRISDWDLAAAHPVHAGRGIQGRREVHNEYCEYKVIYRCDSARNLKPKRVILTTELRDYWLMLAEISPSRLKFAASDALKREVDWEELYGFGVKDPELLSPQERKRLFAVWVAGAAQDGALAKQGVPTYPIGTLNNYDALFMYHPINGLDDLLYIVMFGAHPYARKEGDIWVRPTKDEIFSKPFFGEPTAPVHLACRHADPAAATGAASKAFEAWPT